MDNPEKQFRDFYERQSLAPDRAAAILAEGQKLAAAHRRQKVWWRTAGLAAAVSVVGGLVWITLPDPVEPIPIQIAETGVNLPALQDGVMAFFGDPGYELDQISLNQPELLAYLKSQGAPAGLSVPEAIGALDNLGCEVLNVEGHQVYIMCFYLDGVPRDADGVAMPGKKPMMVAAAPSPALDESETAPPMMKKPTTLVHLLTIPRDQFVGAPQVGDPVSMSQDGEWSFATWAQGDVVYVAATPADAERFVKIAASLSS
ncbi:MAG: hypothetical protein HOH58_04145 [Opitutaceae bacterium]|nr:hypothetical protein [Opitutaceae bacterium]